MSHRRRPTHPVRRVAAGVGLALGLVLVAAGPAAATDPINVTAQITDQVGALDGSTARVQDALDTLGDETVLDLYVVYVSDFSGAGGSQWADDTAVASHLGTEDVLLAVAVDERSFGLSVADDAPLTDAQITSIRTDLVEPALSEDDWAGAAVAAADGLRAAASGSSDSSGGQSDAQDGGSGGGSLLLGLLLIGIVVILLVLVAVALTRRRRTPDPVGRVPGRSRGPDGPDALPTAELARRAGAALVAVDDAITTSDQELGFAQAQFGTAATAQFTAAMADARTQVAEAFRLQQILDDAVPESEPERRRILSTILETCARVSASLDAHTQEFDRLRDLQARAPQVLDEAERAVQDLAATVQTARADLTTLAGAYPPAALASVAANPDQAEALLAGALASVTTGRTALTAGDRGSAVGAARAAQEATAQAQRLLEAVGRAGAELARAGADLDTAIASITADLADVERLAPTDPQVRAAADAGRQAVTAAQQSRTGGDPLTALHTLRTAESALDAALAPFRERAEHVARAQAQLSEALGRLDSQLRAVTDFVETRRGAVGPEARTRLSEAARRAQQARDGGATDPVAALGLAQQAAELAAQAQAIAQSDVQRWEDDRRGPQGGGGANAGALVLGGILIDQLLRGGGGFGGGGFGGGGFGGGGFGGGGGGRGGRGGGGGFGGGGGHGGGRSGRGGGGRF